MKQPPWGPRQNDRPPLWKGQPERQLTQAAAMFADLRLSSLALARINRDIADDAERSLHRIGHGLPLVLAQLDAGDAFVFGLVIDE